MASPHMMLSFLAALLAAVRLAACSSSSPSGTSPEPVLTFCSGQPPDSNSSSPAVTSGEFASFLDALCAGACGVAHMSHSMSWYAAGTNRTVHGVAQCRPDVPVPDCAACLAAASSRLVAGRTACAASAAWHDACFLRYSDRDPTLFREDEYTATVFNATRAPLPYRRGKAAVRRLLVAAGSSTTSSHMCRGVGAGTAAAGLMYGLTRCAAGTSCDDCRRCLRGALAAFERGYNGSAGMQVLRLSCMARYESYPFYNATAVMRRAAEQGIGTVISNSTRIPLVCSSCGCTSAQPTPAPPGGHGSKSPDVSFSDFGLPTRDPRVCLRLLHILPLPVIRHGLLQPHRPLKHSSCNKATGRRRRGHS